jgi:Fe-S cluster assembly protein SufD
MKTSVEIPRTLERWLATGVGPLAGTGLPWLDAARDRARERVRDQGIPTMKDEGWRYTSVKSLTDQPFTLFAEDVTGVEQEDLEDLLIPDLDAHRAVLVNGRFVPGLSSLGDLPAGARAGGLRAILESDPDALEGRLNHVSGDGVHVFSALNTAGLDDGFVFLVDAGVTMERPVELVHLSVGMDEPRLAQPRHVIDLADGAEARIIERYVSLGESLYCTNSVLEVSLGKGARLDHDRVQLESRNAYHITGFYLSQAEDSRYRGVNLGLGGAWARTDLVVRFAGEHADCDLKGLYLAGDGQVMDYHLDVNHAVPHCASREAFKGILYGKGRAVFDGDVRVEVDAQKSDAHLSNKNLILSRNAEIDTKPQLEILADDVKCSHGTTVGQIEPEMLFYLRSRGIAAPIARRMLCLGFAGEIIDALGTEALRAYVADEVGRRLEAAPLES